MLNRGFRRRVEALLPRFLLRAINPFETLADEAVAEFADGLPEGARVLDAGAGECRFEPLFARQQYVAIDRAIGDASWDYSRLHVLGDLERLPLASASCDAAISVVVLEHTREPKEVLGETARVLRPDGRLLIVVPQEWEMHQHPHDYFRFTRHGIEYLLGSTGFRVVRLTPVGGFFWLMGRRSVNLLSFFQGGLGWLLFVVLAPIFGFLVPVVCYFADRLDRRRDFTLGYICEAQRT